MVKLSPAFLVSLLIVMFGVTNAYAADDDDDAPVRHTKKPVHHVLHRGVKEASGHTASRRVTMKVRRHGGLVRASYTPAVETVGDIAGLNNVHDALDLKSGVALVLDQSNSEVLFDKNADVALDRKSVV